MKIRDSLPKRRDNPSKNPTGSNWSEHKPDLREDFHKHCAYCGSFDGFSHTWFEVDHFVPKSLFLINGSIGLCQYDNLVYSCKFCNNVKLKKWPSGDEGVPNIDNKGFVDPVLDEYDEHLYRTNSGSIKWKTDLGKWMVQIGFKFDERDYCVKLLWNLNELRKSVDFLIEELNKCEEDSEEYKILKERTGHFATEYFIFHRILMEYYKTM